MTGRCNIGDVGDLFLLLGDLKYLGHGLFGRLSPRDGRPGRMAVCWFIRSVRSCFCTRLKHDVTCVLLRYRQQNGALSAVVAEEGGCVTGAGFG